MPIVGKYLVLSSTRTNKLRQGEIHGSIDAKHCEMSTLLFESGGDVPVDLNDAPPLSAASTSFFSETDCTDLSPVQSNESLSVIPEAIHGGHTLPFPTLESQDGGFSGALDDLDINDASTPVSRRTSTISLIQKKVLKACDSCRRRKHRVSLFSLGDVNVG